MLNKIFNKAADTFDRIEQMVTRKLPVPDLEGTDKFVQFTAKRGKHGHWTVSSKHNLKQVTTGLEDVSRAYQAAVEKHAGRKPYSGEDMAMNFDTCILVLKDMEESLLKYKATPGGEEPKHHYMAAYRLLPKQFREGLDDLYFDRTEKKGQILPPKAVLTPKPVPGANPGAPKRN